MTVSPKLSSKSIFSSYNEATPASNAELVKPLFEKVSFRINLLTCFREEEGFVSYHVK